MPTMQEQVAERYPALLPLLRQPEIGRLLTQAVQKNWSTGVFQSKFMASRWFRTQSEPARRWWVLGATDPTEARRQRSLYSSTLATQARAMGVALSAAELKYMTEKGLQGGYEPDSAFTLERLIRRSRTGPLPQGALRTATKTIDGLARSEYGLPSNPRWARRRSEMVVQGTLSMDDVENEMREMAIKRFPHMADGLTAGRTVADQVRPYAEVYASELDQQPDQVIDRMFRNTDPAARQLMGVLDPKTSKMRLPTEAEAIRMARSHHGWKATTNGRAMTAGLTNSLLKAFGRRV